MRSLYIVNPNMEISAAPQPNRNQTEQRLVSSIIKPLKITQTDTKQKINGTMLKNKIWVFYVIYFDHYIILLAVGQGD